MGTEGTATIDFSATPTDEASIAVTGQGGILATSRCEAWVMGASTADNDEAAHKCLAQMGQIICSIPTAATGFTIEAHLMAGLATGQFKIQWIWS